MAKTFVDGTGYEITCSKQEAVDWFNKGVVAFATLNGNCMSFFNKCLELDPDFLVVHCVLVSAYVKYLVSE